MDNTQTKTAGRLMRLKTVLAKYGLGRATMYKLIQRGEWPRPIKLAGTRTAAWLESECDQAAAKWIEARDSDRSAA